jgi:cysteine-rich repeat protein
MARLFRSRRSLACGLLLGFASACNDIVALDCDRAPATTACPPGDGGDETSTTDASATASPTTVTTAESTGGDSDTSAEDPTGPTDMGSSCGDGIVDPGEECDDGDLVDIDECDNQCRAPLCGNGSVQPGEDCDLGPANDDHGSCKLDCTAAICGDGIVRWGVESCDGADTDGFSCEAFGYASGELLCDGGCNFDLTQCSFCPNGMETCDAYQPCDSECVSGSVCWYEAGALGTCLPSCMSQKDCPPFEGFFSDCVNELCVIPCDSDCPRGMICQPSLLYPGTVCLW